MKQLFVLLSVVALVALSEGCATMNKTVVTICQLEDSAMMEWATLHNDGVTTDEFDLQVVRAHQEFLAAKQDALAAYQAAGPDDPDYLNAFERVRGALIRLLNVLAPLAPAKSIDELKSKAATAPTL